MAQFERIAILDALTIEDDGILRATAKVARVGTQQYPDGIDLRLPEDVEASLSGYDRSPITIDHSGGMVNKYNKDALVKGFVTNPRYENGWVLVDLVVSDSDTIILMQTTHRYFSVGYDASYKDAPAGVWQDTLGVQGRRNNFYPYDRIQDQISVNHVTITGSPRAGVKATIQDSTDDDFEYISTKQIFDALEEDETLTDSKNWRAYFKRKNPAQIKKKTTKTKDVGNKKKMAKIEYNDIAYEFEGADADKVATIFNKLSKKVADMEMEKADMTSKAEEFEAAKKDMSCEKDKLAAKADSLEAELEELKASSQSRMDADDVQKEVNARLAAWAVAQPVLKLDAIDPSLTVTEIQRKTLKEVYPKLDAKIDAPDNDVYLNTLWDLFNDRVEVQLSFEGERAKETVQNAVKQDAMNPIIAAQEAALLRRTTRKTGV